MKRREVKGKHEESVLNSFRDYMINSGTTFSILEQPDPPDAIVMIGKRKTWIEITDAFLNEELARSITSYPAEDVPHIPTKRKLIINPDQIFEQAVEEVISKKYTKNSMSNIFAEHGPGVLLVGLFSPFVGSDEIINIMPMVKSIKHENDSRFDQIFLYDRDHTFFEVQ
jgi:hypothetical protein